MSESAIPHSEFRIPHSILVTGGTGFVGRALVARLVAEGRECVVISRRPEHAAQTLPAGVTALAYDEPWPPVDAVINLAGESIVGLWTPGKRRRILESRVATTRQLVGWMAQVSPRPGVFLSMSAVGIYGDRPGEVLTEASAPDPAQSFRARVCRAWEAAARPAQALGVRVVTLRLGNVLHPAGGYLGNLLKLYRRTPVFGFGAAESMFSWIGREDAVRLIALALEEDALVGPLNVTAPRPVSQGTFTEAVAQALGRRVWGRLPGRLMRLALGEFSSAFLDSQDVRPAKALAHGFVFRDPALAPFLTRVVAEKTVNFPG